MIPSDDRQLFRYLLIQPEGEPHDPALLVSGIPNWDIGGIITFGRGDQARVVGVQWEGLDPVLEAEGIRGIFTVEPLDD